MIVPHRSLSRYSFWQSQQRGRQTLVAYSALISENWSCCQVALNRCQAINVILVVRFIRRSLHDIFDVTNHSTLILLITGSFLSLVLIGLSSSTDFHWSWLTCRSVSRRGSYHDEMASVPQCVHVRSTHSRAGHPGSKAHRVLCDKS